MSKNNITTQNANTAKSSDCKRLNTLQNNKVTSLTKKSVGGTEQNNALDKMQAKISPAKVTGKPKRGKNFILENKLNVKKISSANKSQVDSSNDIPQNVRNDNGTIEY